MLKKLTPIFIAFIVFANHNLYAINEIAPIVTINQESNQSDPTTILPISFTVVFSKPVNGFEPSDISFAGSTADTSRARTFLSPQENNTYRVIILNIASRGQLRVTIPANSVMDSDGNGNLDSTSNDNTVTYNPNYVFIGGQVRLRSGRILQNINIELILPSGERRYARTNAFGYYRFYNIQTANINLIVTGKRTIGATVGFNLWDDYPNLNIELFPY